MTGRHWFRRDVLLPLFYLLVFGIGFYWLYQQIIKLPVAAESTAIPWIIRIILILYGLLLIVTVRHVLSTYDLERYDPGNPGSLKRLMRRWRYRLPKGEIPVESLMIAYEQELLTSGYRLETESHLLGRIYRRDHRSGLFSQHQVDRVIILSHEPLNVLLVDQILQDAIRYVRSQTDKPSQRNLLILATRMREAEEAASAAAGVVNFLGKFRGGTLGVLFLTAWQHRLFYPADRTLQPRLHRWFQNKLRRRLCRLIRRFLKARAVIPPSHEAVSTHDDLVDTGANDDN
ncbi:MAG: hypothetical protein VB070_04085 [Clostridiaceae bacterium]|nr:hypothetical protein [Clostridiaceae bacterium]